jgi:rhomboid protease GluP
MGNDFGFISLIVYGSGVMYVGALLLTMMFGGDVMGSGSPLGLLSPHPAIQVMLGASGAVPVFTYGAWWSILSAGWLHASILHILMNMMWVKNLGPVTADLYGGPRMVIIYTAGSVAGFLLSSVLGLYPLPKFGADQTVGASAPIFGLLGALMYYGRRSGSSIVHAEAKGYAVAFFVFGLIFPNVDNAAHAGGFIGGYLAGMLMDPLKPERVNHMIVALACMAATALAIVASIVRFLPGILR